MYAFTPLWSQKSRMNFHPASKKHILLNIRYLPVNRFNPIGLKKFVAFTEMPASKEASVR